MTDATITRTHREAAAVNACAIGAPVLLWIKSGRVTAKLDLDLPRIAQLIANTEASAAARGYQFALREVRRMLVDKHPANFAAFSALDTLTIVQRRKGFEWPAFVGYEERIQELEAALDESTTTNARLVREVADYDLVKDRDVVIGLIEIVKLARARNKP